MQINVFDYKKNKIKVELPIKTVDEIDKIFVDILSGDETGFFVLKNGKIIEFDACEDDRMFNWFDGSYVVNGEKEIFEWINQRQ